MNSRKIALVAAFPAMLVVAPLVAQVAPERVQPPTVNVPSNISTVNGETRAPSAPANAPVTVAPHADDPQWEKAIFLLSGYHGLPEKAVFEEQLSTPAETLGRIAHSDDISPIFRDRAIAALAYWPNDELRGFYLELLNAETTSEMNKHRLLGLLASAFGDDAIPSIRPFLLSSDIQFRITAVDALAHIGSEVALREIRSIERVEVNPSVTRRIRSALGGVQQR